MSSVRASNNDVHGFEILFTAWDPSTISETIHTHASVRGANNRVFSKGQVQYNTPKQMGMWVVFF